MDPAIIEPINDPTNVTGLAALVNRNKVDPSLDLAVSESRFIAGRGVTLRTEVNPEEEFSQLMDSIYNPGSLPSGLARSASENARETNGGTARPPAPRASGFPPLTLREAGNESEEEEPLDLGDWDAPEPDPRLQRVPHAERATHAERAEHADPPGNEEPRLFYRPTSAAPVSAPAGAAVPQPQYLPPPGMRSFPRSLSSDLPSRPPAQWAGGGREEEPRNDVRRDPIQAGMRVYSGALVGAPDLEREDEEEDKQFMLECIDELLTELRSMGVDVSRVPHVNTSCTPNNVRKVYDLVQRKYDRARCDVVGTDIIVAGAQLLGTFLDGTRGVGSIRPNLDGWHNTIRPRLRRTRYEVSTLTSSALKQFGIGPAGRLAIELVPSAILYSNMRSGQTGPGYTDDQMAAAMDDLRQYE